MKFIKSKLNIIKILIMTSILLFAIGATSNAANIVSTDKTVESGKSVTITITSKQSLGSYKVTLTDAAGLTLTSASGGTVSSDNKTITDASDSGKTTLGTYTFNAPTVNSDTKYNVKFSITGMETTNLEEILDETNTAVVTVKAKESSTTNNSGTNNNNTTTTPTAPTFTSVNETVYAKSQVNVRSSYSTSSSILATLNVGDSVTRTGKSSEWSKVTYNGKTAYISSAYLTTTKPTTTTTDDKKDETTGTTTDTNKNTEKSNNKNLKSLVVTPTGLEPVFDKETTQYAMTIGSDVDTIKVEAVAEDDKAKVSVSGNSDLKIGKNTISIKVTAEDETVRTYKIIVTKENKELIKLKELLIEGITLQPEFDGDVHEYNVTLEKSNVSELNITATANKESASVEIIGNTNLEPGNNLITILVKESDTESATYQIIVNIPEQVAATPKNDMELYKSIGIGVVGAIIVIAIIIVILKYIRRNKDEKVEDDFEEYNPYRAKKVETEEKKEKINELSEIDNDDLPKSLRKNVEEKNDKDAEEITANVKQKSRIDELYSDDEDSIKRKKGKHF